MSPVEEAYEKYKLSERKKNIGGEIYYKIVCKECFKFTEIGPILSILLPGELFNGKTFSIIEDEYGRQFKLIGPGSIRFIGGIIPEWYFHCWSFTIKGIDDKNQIGEYVTLAKIKK